MLVMNRFQLPRIVRKMFIIKATTGSTMPKLSATAIVFSQWGMGAHSR
jgi:hypothetical protein